MQALSNTGRDQNAPVGLHPGARHLSLPYCLQSATFKMQRLRHPHAYLQGQLKEGTGRSGGSELQNFAGQLVNPSCPGPFGGTEGALELTARGKVLSANAKGI